MHSLSPLALRAADSQQLESDCDPNDWIERFTAFLLLVACGPLLLALMLLIRATSRGPALFRQTRTGKHQREFTIYKLRTMRLDAERLTGPIWSPQDDPRITPLGKFLRFCHLDELPQLINVARGDMAFVGPRPERPVIIDRLLEEIPDYNRRHVVRPGITGLAQINLPPDTTVDDVHRKLELDLHYIENANRWLDLQIIGCTCFRLFGLRSRGLAAS